MPVSAPHRPAAPGSSRRLPLVATAAPDAALVARAAQGDERAFELLFQRHRPDVMAYATRMLRDHGRAEDVVQDVFVSAMRAILRAAPEDQPVHVRAWLREIARRACIDQWRGASRRGEVSLDAPERLLAGDALRLADDDSLTRATDDREAVATLRRAFADLPELQHAVLVQRELEGR
jgi:RNA polymerase sigma factor (sigma-70 family)